MNTGNERQARPRTLKLTLAYDGGDFAGWQVQPNGVTVQELLEKAFASVTGESLRITASGRTDAGVHAIAQVASVRTGSPLDCDTMRRALNANLPNAICVRNVEVAGDGFHAIRDAVGKRYRYVMTDEPHRNVFWNERAWWVRGPLDVEAMRHASGHLLGEHDFSSFEAAGAPRKSSVRNVRDLTVERCETHWGSAILIEVEADGFLYNMVRNIVGSLVEVGRGKRDPQWIREVLDAQDRKQAGPTAPPEGLYLLRVDYDSP